MSGGIGRKEGVRAKCGVVWVDNGRVFEFENPLTNLLLLCPAASSRLSRLRKSHCIWKRGSRSGGDIPFDGHAAMECMSGRYAHAAPSVGVHQFSPGGWLSSGLHSLRVARRSRWRSKSHAGAEEAGLVGR